MMTIKRDELVITNPEAKDNDFLGYFEVELYGIAKYMKSAEVQAIFGGFRKTGNRTVLYSASVLANRDGKPGHCYESEFEDDLIALKSGRLN